MMTIFEEIEQLEQEAAVFGLQWETSDQIMTQIRNECLEIEEHLHFPEQREALQDESVLSAAQRNSKKLNLF